MHDDASRNQASCASGQSLSSADSILHEIRHALEALLDWGKETVIDLSALPVGPADLAQLEEVLGDGEISATIEAGGTSRVSETGYPGVWLVEHLGDDATVRTRQLQVTFVPQLLKADPSDITDGLRTLEAGLGDQPPKTE